jgi:hypothetical protein
MTILECLLWAGAIVGNLLLLIEVILMTEKQIRELARKDWLEQCKNYMMYKTPFKDKTAKDCYKRHMKIYGKN